MVVEGGRFVGQTTPENASRDGLTVVNLSDDWLPYIFSEEPEKPQPLRPYLIDLANGRMRGGSNYARAREDRYFEAFGIFPSLNLVRRRLADSKRHACHEKVKDGVLYGIVTQERHPAGNAGEGPEPRPRDGRRTAHDSDRADDLAATLDRDGKAGRDRDAGPPALRRVAARRGQNSSDGSPDGRGPAGLPAPAHARGQREHRSRTRTALLGDSREHDFRALLRALRERVVDATGLLEDGSALGVLGEVQGRQLDSAEFRPLPVEAATKQAQPAAAKSRAEPAGSAGSGASREGMGTLPGFPSEQPGKITGAPDLIAAATQAASQALGWTSPEAVLASTLVAPPTAPSSSRKSARKTAAPKAPAPLPAAVAIRLPSLPPYHGPKMDLRAEIDRGEVVLKRPALDKDGKKKWHPPVSDRPTLTLYARVGDREVALCRWPTTIGGWKTIQQSDGSMALKYKASVTGDDNNF